MASTLFLVLFVVTACGSGDDSKSEPGPLPPPSLLSVNPSLVTISESQSMKFSATVPPGTDGTVEWKILDDPAIGQLGNDSGIYTSPDLISQASQIKVQATSLRNDKITATAKILLVKSGPIAGLSNKLSIPLQIVLEQSGLSAFVSDLSKKAIFRLNLVTGEISTVIDNLDAVDGLALDETGSSIFFSNRTSPGSILNFRLEGGQLKPVATKTPLFSPSSLLIESDGQHLLVAELTANQISRINLLDGSVQHLAENLDAPTGLLLEQGGTSVLVAERIPGKLSRIRLNSTGNAQPVADGLDSPTGIAMEPGGSTVLVVQQSDGNVARVKINLAGPKAPTASTIVPPPATEIDIIVSQLKLPSGIAVEPGAMTALVTELLPPGIMRIKLVQSR